jgi:hypothetical protein
MMKKRLAWATLSALTCLQVSAPAWAEEGLPLVDRVAPIRDQEVPVAGDGPTTSLASEER